MAKTGASSLIKIVLRHSVFRRIVMIEGQQELTDCLTDWYEADTAFANYVHALLLLGKQDIPLIVFKKVIKEKTD